MRFQNWNFQEISPWFDFRRNPSKCQKVMSHDPHGKRGWKSGWSRGCLSFPCFLFFACSKRNFRIWPNDQIIFPKSIKSCSIITLWNIIFATRLNSTIVRAPLASMNLTRPVARWLWSRLLTAISLKIRKNIRPGRFFGDSYGFCW